MFVYTIEHILLGVVVAVIVGFFAYYHLSLRWSMWRGRKIAQRHLADEKDKLMKEMDELRPNYPNASDGELEKIVRGQRLRALIDALEKSNHHRNDNPDVRNQRTKGTVVHVNDQQQFRAEGGFHSPLVITSIPDPVPVGRLTQAINDFNQGYEVTPFVEQEKGKGNDEPTGNLGTTRSSGHRTDRDDSPCTQKGWRSERLESGSGWGSESSSRHSSPDTGSADSGSAPSCD